MPDPGHIPSASARLSLADASLVFYESDDRLAHALAVPESAAPVVIRSVESDPEDPGLGPASPVFQETHIEEDAASSRLMAVGQWRKIHYSAVFLRSVDQPETLLCDIAARVRQAEPIALASTYTIHATASDILTADESCIEIAIIPGSQTLRIEAGVGSRLLLAEAGRAALRLQILPSQRDASIGQSISPARTIQWKYSLRLSKTDSGV